MVGVLWPRGLHAIYNITESSVGGNLDGHRRSWNIRRWFHFDGGFAGLRGIFDISQIQGDCAAL